MFSFFSGKIKEINQNLILLVNDFFGIEIYTCNSYELEEKIDLYIYSNFSSENGNTFFGFANKKELNFFLLLISVPGLGNKTAIKLMYNLGIKNLAIAISEKNEEIIIKTPGIGKKISNRIITDLWNKIPDDLLNGENNYSLISLLLDLKYKKDIILSVLSQIDKNLTLEESFNLALREINKIKDNKII